jgi:hypothetical protein
LNYQLDFTTIFLAIKLAFFMAVTFLFLLNENNDWYEAMSDQFSQAWRIKMQIEFGNKFCYYEK